MPFSPPGTTIETSESPDVFDGPVHAHHWRIAEQGGPHSAGSCCCGETRQFPNGWDSGPTGWLATRAPARMFLR